MRIGLQILIGEILRIKKVSVARLIVNLLVIGNLVLE